MCKVIVPQRQKRCSGGTSCCCCLGCKFLAQTENQFNKEFLLQMQQASESWESQDEAKSVIKNTKKGKRKLKVATTAWQVSTAVNVPGLNPCLQKPHPSQLLHFPLLLPHLHLHPPRLHLPLLLRLHPPGVERKIIWKMIVKGRNKYSPAGVAC